MPTKKAAAVATLPIPPSLRKTIGPSFILLGLAFGSGELILWPYLSANWGLGLIWGALLGISLQFLLNTEVMRYTLAWGESVFVGWRKLSWLIPIWFILSSFIPWAIPSFSALSGQIVHHLFPQLSQTFVAICLLLITGFTLSVGKTLYKTMETVQKSIILLGIPFVALLTIIFTRPADWALAAQGFMGQGEGWQFFPPGIAIASFLGAFAYAGAGGNLGLSQSYYIKEKGFGMGAFSQKITSLFAGGLQAFRLEGQLFAHHTPVNKQRWKQWWQLVNLEHFLVFWFLGLLTISMLVVLSYSLVYGSGLSSGLGFLFGEANAIAARTYPFVGTAFLLMTALMLFTTQTGVLESSARIISENVLLLFYKKGRKFNASLMFYVSLWSQIILGIVILLTNQTEPRLLLQWSAVLNGVAMMVAFPLLLWLNTVSLPHYARPGIFRKIGLIVAFAFFAFFVTLLLQQ